MVKCSAPRCSSSTYNKTPDITFHKFPNDVHLKNSWLANMNVTNWQPTKSCVLCSKHFDNRNIDKSGFRARLFHGAIPTLFDLPLQENNTFPKPGPTRKRNATGDILCVLIEPSTVQNKIEPQPSTSKQSDNISFTIQDIDESEPALAISAKEQHSNRIKNLQDEVMKLRSIIKLKNKKIKAFSQKNRRLKSKVSKFSDVITHLKKKLSHDDTHILLNIHTAH